MANRFATMYEGTPPWEIGRPQPAFAELAGAGRLDPTPGAEGPGLVLDVGCGTGELPLALAQRGHRVRGIDLIPAAIDQARAKAAARGIAEPTVSFEAFDALRLAELGVAADVAIDCGLFHVFSDADRGRYVAALSAAVRSGGRLLLLCFSERETRPGGPRRVTEAELRQAFAAGWQEVALVPSWFHTLLFPDPSPAWLAEFRRT